ncbi:MAG TPA: RNA polymerase sigma factor [Candidatus Limnocylindrales bacterium]|nr:RNA polymerase sigma factor [Candidatus Limnocylindrales bacterium]
MKTMDSSDADLVAQSLAGDRDAFGQIVARHQSLLCSLAYSATGSLSHSEDLAQETFVTAWKQLANLREPEKLRSWLCRISRNLTYDALRKHEREPSHRAESLEEIPESRSPEPLPGEQTISNEEQAILWRSLARIPEIYREPLVLFYREHQSIEIVAQNLELTEDAVKQRLSRGRKMLHEEVLAFVEGALEKTSPGKKFTFGVVAALPLLATTAKSATAGATAAKGSAALKILFMTKTTQAIIVAAVTVTAVLTTQTVVHHYRAPVLSRVRQVQEPLTPQRAMQAQQTARDFFEALGKADWNKIDKLCPPGFPMSAQLDDATKNMLNGLTVVSLGDPFTKPPYPQVFVPYEIKFKTGETKKFNLAVRQDNPERKWYFDGGF